MNGRTRKRRTIANDTRGAIHVEFLIVLFPVLLTFLFLIQLSHAFIAKLAVQHAANSAARSAIVVLAEEEDDPARIPTGDELSALVPGAGSGGGGAMRSIENAAAIRLLSVSPPLASVSTARRDVRSALGGADGTFLTSSAQYARRAVDVQVTPRTPTAGDTVRVEVTYWFDCAPPGVASSHRFIQMKAISELPYQGRRR
jgi:hypothetical protein